MGQTRTRPGPLGWTGGLFGKWENGPRHGRQFEYLFSYVRFLYANFVFVQGDSYPEFAHSAPLGRWISYVVGCDRGRTLAFLCFISGGYISLWDENVVARINK